jgi:hypothetical protein
MLAPDRHILGVVALEVAGERRPASVLEDRGERDLEPLLVLAALDAEIHEPAAAYGKRRRRRRVERASAATQPG